MIRYISFELLRLEKKCIIPLSKPPLSNENFVMLVNTRVSKYDRNVNLAWRRIGPYNLYKQSLYADNTLKVLCIYSDFYEVT